MVSGSFTGVEVDWEISLFPHISTLVRFFLIFASASSFFRNLEMAGDNSRLLLLDSVVEDDGITVDSMGLVRQPSWATISRRVFDPNFSASAPYRNDSLYEYVDCGSMEQVSQAFSEQEKA